MSKKDTGAGKGDKLRRGITQNEWNKKWEEIFGKKEQDELKESYEQSKRNREEHKNDE